MLNFQFKFKFPLLFLSYFLGFQCPGTFIFGGLGEVWNPVWTGRKLLLSIVADNTFAFCAIGLSLFLLASYRTTFSVGLMASFLSTPSLGQISRAASCSSHCCVYRQTFNKALKLLSSFENLATYFCVGFGYRNWALMLCGWALLLFLTSEDVSGCSGGGSWGL